MNGSRELIRLVRGLTAFSALYYRVKLPTGKEPREDIPSVSALEGVGSFDRELLGKVVESLGQLD